MNLNIKEVEKLTDQITEAVKKGIRKNFNIGWKEESAACITAVGTITATIIDNIMKGNTNGFYTE